MNERKTPLARPRPDEELALYTLARTSGRDSSPAVIVDLLFTALEARQFTRLDIIGGPDSHPRQAVTMGLIHLVHEGVIASEATRGHGHKKYQATSTVLDIAHSYNCLSSRFYSEATDTPPHATLRKAMALYAMANSVSEPTGGPDELDLMTDKHPELILHAGLEGLIAIRGLAHAFANRRLQLIKDAKVRFKR